MEAIITRAAERDSRAEPKNRFGFFFFFSVAIPVIFCMWKNPDNSQARCCLPLSQSTERCHIQPTSDRRRVSCARYGVVLVAGTQVW